MADSFTEYTSEGWLSRLGGSIKSVLVGVLFFLVSFPLLFWNEGRAVKTARSLDEGASAVVSVPSDRVDPTNDKKLVHTTGQATTDEVLNDADFGIALNAIKLIRNVEMYQWEERTTSEERKKLGGGTERVTRYDYEKVWASQVIDSDLFKHPEDHRNPSRMPFESRTLVARKVTLGAFTLSSEQVGMLDEGEDLQIDPAMEAAPRRVKVSLDSGMFHTGADPSSPDIGAVRVRFEVVRPKAVSVVGQQTGDTFEPYKARAGDDILLVKESALSAAAMFEAARTENTIITWVLRVVGWLLMFFGLLMVFRPISVFGDVVPIVGSILGAGLGVFSFLVASALSTLTMGLAWVFYRPLLGFILLAASVGAFVLLSGVARKRKQGRAVAAT
jgi:hypothetical protein